MLKAAITKLLGKSSEASAAELRAALVTVETDIKAAEAKSRDLEAKREAALLTASNDRIREMDDAVNNADVDVQRLWRARQELEAASAAAEGQERAANLTARKERAEQLTAAAIDAVNGELRTAYSAIRTIIRAVAEAEEAVREVNVDLPPDERLTGPEEWRNQPRRQEAVDLRRERVWRWTTERGEIVPDDAAKRVVANRDNPKTGYIPSPQPPPGVGFVQPAMSVVQREFLRAERLPETIGEWVKPLANMKLPPVRAGETDGWDKRTAVWAPFETDAPTLIEALDKIEAASRRVRPADHRRPTVVYESIPAAPTTKAA